MGDGTFQNPLAGLGLPAIPTGPGDGYITSMVAGDFNGDGKLDLAIADSGDGVTDFGGVFILLGNGNGTFQTPKFYPTGTYAVDLVAGDFSGNGRLDLAVAGLWMDGVLHRRDLGADGQRRRHIPARGDVNAGNLK